jgi:ribosomal protein L11 methyltransferase
MAITAFAGRPTIRIEVFGISQVDAMQLKRTFGGTAAKQKRDRAIVSQSPRKPINVRGKLSIISSKAERSQVRKSTPALVIPAGMAFGTGEHATTLNCLRFLVDFVAARGEKAWTALDLGCGSGILALAAKLLGATKVIAADFDRECVRITRENCGANKLRGVSVRRLDVLAWKPDERFDLVCANLYSTILVRIAKKLARSIAPGGTLIFSGVMRDQEAEVTQAFKRAGLKVTGVKRQGKWIAGTAAGRNRS